MYKITLVVSGKYRGTAEAPFTDKQGRKDLLLLRQKKMLDGLCTSMKL